MPMPGVPNGSDCGSLVPRSHNLTLFVRFACDWPIIYDSSMFL